MKTDNCPRERRLALPSGITLGNRVVIPAMASDTANEDGMVSAKTIAHYQRLAQAGAGLVFVEYTYVLRSGRSEQNQLGLDEDRKIEGLSAVARALREAGAIPGIQLTHAGGKTSRDLTGGVLQGPSTVSVPVKDRAMEIPAEVSLPEIAEWIDAFAMAAQRAQRAGFQVVEIHAAHGYGLNQWLSPITNQRRDAYGGGLKNRMRLLLEIVRRIRETSPSITLSVRIPGMDFLPGGLSLDDGVRIAQSLEAHGVEIINVSSGIGGWRRPRDRRGQGYLVAEAAEIQRHINAPVIGVGGIETGEFIDALIAENRVALAAVGRAILQDPLAWKRKLQCAS